MQQPSPDAQETTSRGLPRRQPGEVFTGRHPIDRHVTESSPGGRAQNGAPAGETKCATLCNPRPATPVSSCERPADDRPACGHGTVHVDFVEFYQATSRRTLRYAYGLTGDLPQAQDVVQEAYARAWQRWRKVADYDDSEAWLRLVVTRLVFDWWRHLGVRRRALLDHPTAVAAPSEDTVLLTTALKQLPPAQRRALALHYLLDLPIAQIAAETGVPEGTVKSWLSRGRAGLADALRDEAEATVLPDAEETAQRGRRRARQRTVATVTAACLAVL
ncbi:MAG: SigE family RNA polymerase sigma factor, partial [Hamadaea sp.]|nr:SigE family RNA polymerase sigma factor [Hamadaea sp.]